MLYIIVVFAQLISINIPLKGATGIDCAILSQMLFQSTYWPESALIDTLFFRDFTSIHPLKGCDNVFIGI